jgi:hypothetical protein
MPMVAVLARARHGSVSQGHAHDKQADGVVSHIAEKVERVGLQRGRARGEASTNLHREFGRVNGQHKPQGAPEAWIRRAKFGPTSTTASAHPGRRFDPIHSIYSDCRFKGGKPSMDLAIGELARRSGYAVQTLRYYERIGLMPKPPRTSGGQRRYGEDLLRRLLFIRHARGLGFEILDIRDRRYP